LFSAAAAETSIQCGEGGTQVRDDLSERLRAAAAAVLPGEWVRAVGYDERIAGNLSAVDIDDMLGPFNDRPVRIQHRGGHAWYLNSVATAALAIDADTSGPYF